MTLLLRIQQNISIIIIELYLKFSPYTKKEFDSKILELVGRSNAVFLFPSH